MLQEIGWALNSSFITGWATQIACIAGLVIGSDAALKIVISACTPPPPPESPETKPSEPPLKGHRKIFNKKALKALIGPLIMFSMQMNIIFILPRYTSTKVQDTFWCIFTGFFLSINFDAAIRAILPVPTSIKYIRNDTPQPFTIKQSYIAKYPHRPIIAVLMSIGIITSVSQGINIFKPLAAASWVIVITANVSYPRVTMKHTVGWMNAYILGTPIIGILVGLIIAGVINLSGGDSDKSSGEQTPPRDQMSQWVLSLLLIAGSAVPTLFISLFVGLTYRYYFSRTQTTLLIPPSAPGEAVNIPLSSPSFTKPTFRATIIVLSTTIIVAKAVIGYFTLDFDYGLFDVCIVVFTVPVVSIAMAVKAYRMGEIKSWWQYEERWLPKAPEETAPAAGDLEAAPASDDETEKLLKQ